MEASAAKQLVRPFLEATNLSGMFVQACWGPSSRLRDTQLMQLPHLTSKHLDLLGRLGLTITKADLGAGKGIFYRLRAGPLADEGTARGLCKQLTRRQIGCLVIRPMQ